MLSKASFILGCLTTIAAASAAYAQDAAPPSAFSLGIGAASSVSPYRGYDDKIWPIPLVDYDSERFYVQALSAGFYLIKDKAYDVSIDTTLATNYFKPSDTSNPSLKRLSARDPSLMTGVRFRYRATWGLLQANVAHDVLGNSVGETAQVEYGYPITQGVLSLIPSVGESWDNGKFNAYYYGITDGAAEKSGLSPYRPGGSWSPYLKLTAAYRISPKWSAFAQARYSRLDNAISDSPMVDTRELTSYLVGISYKF